jgi:hypothetical protein
LRKLLLRPPARGAQLFHVIDDARLHVKLAFHLSIVAASPDVKHTFHISGRFIKKYTLPLNQNERIFAVRIGEILRFQTIHSPPPIFDPLQILLESSFPIIAMRKNRLGLHAWVFASRVPNERGIQRAL